MKPVAVVLVGSIQEKDAQALRDAGYTVVYEYAEGNVRLIDRTLRDEFAIAALNGILSNHETMRQGVELTKKMLATDALCAINSALAYAYADHMLAERAKKE